MICPNCKSDLTYPNQEMMVCTQCFNEWIPSEDIEENTSNTSAIILDSNGNARQDIDDIWNLRIEPLLKEYLRGMPDSIDKVELLKNAFTA